MSTSAAIIQSRVTDICDQTTGAAGGTLLVGSEIKPIYFVTTDGRVGVEIYAGTELLVSRSDSLNGVVGDKNTEWHDTNWSNNPETEAMKSGLTAVLIAVEANPKKFGYDPRDGNDCEPTALEPGEEIVPARAVEDRTNETAENTTYIILPVQGLLGKLAAIGFPNPEASGSWRTHTNMATGEKTRYDSSRCQPRGGQ